MADFHQGDQDSALDVLQSFNTAIQTDSSHKTSMTAREIVNVVASQANTTGSITENANIQNMLVDNVDEYNKYTNELLAMNIQSDINIFTNANLERDLGRLQKTKKRTRANVVQDRQHFLANRYQTEQNWFNVVAVQLAFWMEALVFLIIALNGEGYTNTSSTLILIFLIVGGYCGMMFNMLRQNADRRTDVFNKFYWSSTQPRSNNK